MIPELRHEFNRQWRPELYSEFLRRADGVAGRHVEFRLSETPVFLPFELVEKMIRYGRELCDQLTGNTTYLEAARAQIPARFRVPNEAAAPLFVQADFGLVESAAGRYEPKLVEIQGFPSLYAFQPALARTYAETYHLDPKLTSYLNGLDESAYTRLLERAILNGHAPEHVALLEIDPYEQKTAADFVLTQKLLGIRIADIRQLEKRGRKLYLDGVEVRRIYNRVIADELVRKNIRANFEFRDDLHVEWAGDPNWFFLLSKFSLPWFRHECVPETFFLDSAAEIPADLENYVLKPLYSFAGLGVKIAPTADDLAGIPGEERHNFILQRKMNFAATIETPSGRTKAEIRVMYIHDGSQLQPVTTIIRTGRGKMMGVDFNKNLDWVGASAGFVTKRA
ncbi:MAG TPA: hypothetical protein VKX25_06380 [Bryobacteraceae bacterium]|nr:hypothetical protein [Bryobacteraceae bacterium]